MNIRFIWGFQQLLAGDDACVVHQDGHHADLGIVGWWKKYEDEEEDHDNNEEEEDDDNVDEDEVIMFTKMLTKPTWTSLVVTMINWSWW